MYVYLYVSADDFGEWTSQLRVTASLGTTVRQDVVAAQNGSLAATFSETEGHRHFRRRLEALPGPLRRTDRPSRGETEGRAVRRKRK